MPSSEQKGAANSGRAAGLAVTAQGMFPTASNLDLQLATDKWAQLHLSYNMHMRCNLTCALNSVASKMGEDSNAWSACHLDFNTPATLNNIAHTAATATAHAPIK